MNEVGFWMLKSAKRIVIEPVMVIMPPLRKALRSMLIGRVTPWRVSSPLAVSLSVAPSPGRAPSSMGVVSLKVAVG